LVQLPEVLDQSVKEQQFAAECCAKLGKPRNIAELTKERLRRAGKKVREENPMFAGDLGFRVFKLASSNIRAWEPNRDDLPTTLHDSIEHLKTDRTEQDILFELLLKLGLDLTIPSNRSPSPARPSTTLARAPSGRPSRMGRFNCQNNFKRSCHR